MTTEELKPHLSNFTDFVIDGKQTPPPRDMKITVYFDGTNPGISEAFFEDKYWHEIGMLKVFIKSWIEHSELLNLLS